jgi:methylation protein EvaC
MGIQPLANKYPKNLVEMEGEYVQEMEVFFCDECNYANIPCNIDRAAFFEDYYYLSSVNKELVAHFERLALTIEKHKPKFVVDVGSNDGILLRPLKNLGIPALGIDPSENVSAIANAEGLDTLVGFYDSSVIEKTLSRYERPDFLCASSVFTHFEKPKEFFEVSSKLLAEDGLILVEVEYIKKIIEELAFERLYFDRPHYYSIKSLREIADRSGFTMIDVSHISAHGGSIRAIFCRKGTRAPLPVVAEEIQAESEYLNRSTILEKFHSFKLACIELTQKIKNMKDDGLMVAAYGCPARFSTITNIASIGPEYLPFVIDDSSLKQGRFSPGMHIPIVGSGSAIGVDVFVVFAHEYISSIKQKLNMEKVRFYKPVPFTSL